MNEPINNWLMQKANLPASLAAGIVYPDQKVFTHFYSRSFASILRENVWPTLAEIAHELGGYELPNSNLRWGFQNALVYSSCRPDGLCVLIVTSRNLSKEDTTTLEGLLTEFQTL